MWLRRLTGHTHAASMAELIGSHVILSKTHWCRSSSKVDVGVHVRGCYSMLANWALPIIGMSSAMLAGCARPATICSTTSTPKPVSLRWCEHIELGDTHDFSWLDASGSYSMPANWALPRIGMIFTERLNDIAGQGQCRTCALAIANERSFPSGQSHVLVCVRSADCTAQIRVTDEGVFKDFRCAR